MYEYMCMPKAFIEIRFELSNSMHMHEDSGTPHHRGIKLQLT